MANGIKTAFLLGLLSAVLLAIGEWLGGANGMMVAFIIAAVISPGTDVVSQCLMAGPMLALYGVSIFVAWAFAKPRNFA